MRKRVLNIETIGNSIPLPQQFDGWEHVRFDINPQSSPDAIMDAVNLFSLPEASFDAIYCPHCLVYYSPGYLSLILAGFWRLLRPDGFAEILAPDLMEIMERVVRRNLDLDDIFYSFGEAVVSVHEALYGAKIEPGGENFYSHRCGFSERSLLRCLYEHGFPWVASCRQDLEIRAIAFKCRPAPRKMVDFNSESLALAGGGLNRDLSRLAMRAEGLWGEGEFEAAVAMANIVFQNGAKTVDICLMLGEYALKKQDYRNAADMFREAVTLDDESLQGHLGLLRSLDLSGNKPLGVKHLRSIAKKDKELVSLVRSML